ncbi:uncharacterized protein C1orf87 homolog isoform X2 [Paralichthys olivaceus]|uniref:uncharacterized protein C1orf87 homolog isoform X2 n=1 Tax=Paralichthys olivaceus TaxID=8255 RepID=UPI003751A1ED
MAQKNTTGAKTKTVPRLVVKIVGSKQVKQFIQEPHERDTDQEETAAEAADDRSGKPAEKPEASASHSRRENRGNSALWDVIKEVPDRSCVTAPTGDRSRSYIHPKTPHVADCRAAAAQETNCSSERRGTNELSSAVRRELSDWLLSSLRSAEVEVAALDPSSRGTVNRSDITRLFLRNGVPLKLPTFSLLLQIFSDENDPEQIYHRNLLHFIETCAFPEERN